MNSFGKGLYMGIFIGRRFCLTLFQSCGDSSTLFTFAVLYNTLKSTGSYENGNNIYGAGFAR